MKHTNCKFLGFFKKVIQQDYLFSIISKIIGVFIALIYSVFFNRYLGAELKGEAAVISNYAGLIGSFACLGMYQAYPFYRKKNKDEFYPFVNTMTSFYFLILILSIAFLFLAQTVSLGLRIALVLMTVQSYIRHINYVVTIENPRRRNFASIIINFTDLIVILLMFLLTKATYENMVLVLFIQVLINLVISYSNLRTKLKNFRFTLSRLFKYARFGFIPMVSLFLMTVNYRIDILMLERFSNVTMAQVGIYSVGMALAEKVWLIPDAVKDILLSKLCKGKGEEEVAKVIRINLAVILILIAVIAVLAKPLVLWVYGTEFAGADTVTIIILCGTIGMIFYKMIYIYNISKGKRVASLIFLVVAAVFNVIGNYFLIPIWGINGAALVSVVSYTICGMCFLINYKITSHISIFKIIIIQKEDLVMIKKFFRSRKSKVNNDENNETINAD